MLEQLAFQDAVRARRILSRLFAEIPESSRIQLEYLLTEAPDPDEAVRCLESYWQRQPESFRRLLAHPSGLRLLLAILFNSRFLTEEVLQHPEWLEERLDSPYLYRVFRFDQFQDRLAVLMQDQPGVPPPLQLAEFRRRMILRVLLRDVLGYASLPEITEELSSLADAVLDFTYQRIREQLVARYGVPQFVGAKGDLLECGFAVIALGKLGGRELNYSSDIDLMFLYSGPGETSGPDRISNKEFFNRLANQYTALLSTYTPKGHCYRVDLRLRPDGSLGEVCMGLEGMCSYYRTRARDWELQMLLKARAAAGSLSLGRKFLQIVEPLIYSTTLDFGAVESMSETRDRIAEKLAKRRSQDEIDVKLMPGGIRDIEFLVQCLQRLHGGRDRWVRSGGTMLALSRLHDKGFLSDAEYGTLSNAYQLLRLVEHRLQFYDDRQLHTLPIDKTQLDVLARRIPALSMVGARTGEALLTLVREQTESVRDIYERVIHAQQPIYYGLGTPTDEHGDNGAGEDEASVPHPPEEVSVSVAATGAGAESNIVRFLDQIAPRLAQEVRRRDLHAGLAALEHFLEQISGREDLLGLLNDDSKLAGYALDIFGLSPYFSEQLNRTPDLLEEVRAMRLHPNASPDIREIAENTVDPDDLRKAYRRAMFRIECQSLCLSAPVFPTLMRTSDLADAAIAASYRMAVALTAESRPPAQADYAPAQQMMVIALGRLGMREFDLGSDADLVFVIPDEDAAENVFWQRVAEKIIDIVSAYTGSGVLFTVDTRLRPHGRSGPLVQTVSTVKEYFSRSAEAWEGITYMKSRAIAGNVEAGTQFLTDLQDVDWRRYGQSGRSIRDLRQMRMRLQREMGQENPIKSGFGGYYDIDFALMYLRLKAAGIFFKVLNTEERIDIIERMGHLDRNDAAFLRDAATFYRAIDHGMRLISGHSAGSLPSAGTVMELLTDLVARWTPDHLHDQPLELELEQIRARTREFFDRLFAASGN